MTMGTIDVAKICITDGVVDKACMCVRDFGCSIPTTLFTLGLGILVLSSLSILSYLVWSWMSNSIARKVAVECDKRRSMK
jgi:hypothetical protein